MTKTDPAEFARHRALWSAALLAILQDYHRDYHKSPDPQRELDAMRRYLDSRDGRTMQACAGVEVPYRRAVAMVTMPSAEFRRRITKVQAAGAA